MNKRFCVSFAGESEYDIDGTRYCIRYFANSSPSMAYNDGVYDQYILPTVGTVRYHDTRLFHTFPPAAVVALFPGFIGARYSADWQVEYDGQKPETRPMATVTHYIESIAVANAERVQVA